jgi:multidrug efflux pump subunit AcrA (membrane-fusion protein)
LASFLAQGKMPEYEQASAKLQAQKAQVDLLQSRLDRTVLKADADGVVITGDLRQDIGRSVQTGEELLEIAPLGTLLLEVQVEQGDVSYVRAGQKGSFTTKAAPDRRIPFTVTSVRPKPEVRGGGSYFIAEAVVDNSEALLSPGMEGAAKVEVDRRNVTWVVTRKMVNWLRLHLWW